MNPVNSKIIVSVDYSQKEKISIGGNDVLLAKQFSDNRRESNPVVCSVVNGGGIVKNGTNLLVHHNRFVEDSPHHLGDNIYSLPYSPAIFAKIDDNGNPHSMCDNIIVEHIYPAYSPLIPPHLKKPDKCKYRVLSNGFGYKKNQIIFCFFHSNYEIIYVWKGVEKRILKVSKMDIVGKYVK